MRRLLTISTILAGLLAPVAAVAVCVGSAGVPFNCTGAAAVPGVNDLVLGGITSGAQNGQTVRWTWGQVFTGTPLVNPSITNGTISSLNSPLLGLYGGTGIANSGKTITLGGSLSTSGAYTLGLTLTGNTALTLPTAGTMYSGHGLIGVQTFCGSGCTSAGAGPFTYTPSTGTNRVEIEVQAAGGGSGGCATTSGVQNCVSLSGYGGSYCRVLYTTGFSGVTVTLGAAGTAGAAGANAGAAGGTTTVGSLLSAVGGAGGGAGSVVTSALVGLSGNVPAGTSACTVTGGTLVYKQLGGTPGPAILFGVAASTLAGKGGDGVLGFGGPATIGASGNSSGNAGLLYGGGASGATTNNVTNTAGSAGAGPIVIIHEYN